MKTINKEIAELKDVLEIVNRVGVSFLWQKMTPFNAIDLPITMFDTSIPQGNRYNLVDLANYQFAIIQRLQAQLAERDKLLGECEEVLSRFDVSVLTHISRSMYSDLMYKLITKPTEE